MKNLKKCKYRKNVCRVGNNYLRAKTGKKKGVEDLLVAPFSSRKECLMVTNRIKHRVPEYSRMK